MTKTWLVTGSGAGLGKLIAEAALSAGNNVLVTARRPDQILELVSRFPGRAHPFILDVTNEAQAIAAVEKAVEQFGSLDVVVNNAGYGEALPFEQVASVDFRRLVDTNFFGVVNLTRAALPVMRKQGSGHIIQISSVGGRFAAPGNAAYHAAKWAVGGFTEALAQETAGFGVKVTALEPGGMRTNWGKHAFGAVPQLLPEYEGTVGAIFAQLEHYWGNENSDPAKVAQIVLKVADADSLPAHILLGSDALEMARGAEKARAEAAAQWEQVSAWTDHGVDRPAPNLPTG